MPTRAIRPGGWFILAAFILAPLLLAEYGARLRPLPPHLLTLLLAALPAFIWAHKKLAHRRLWARPPSGWMRGPLLRAGVVGLAATAYALCLEPEAAFRLPLERTRLWLLIMVLYPVLSVLPQELLFRVCLMELFKTGPRGRPWTPAAAITGSALLFAWAHVIYASPVAMRSTFLAGLVLGWNYHHNQNRPGGIWPLFLEHALYGQIIFTTGLGHYFYILREGL